jgi:hypothetical protein
MLRKLFVEFVVLSIPIAIYFCVRFLRPYFPERNAERRSRLSADSRLVISKKVKTEDQKEKG